MSLLGTITAHLTEQGTTYALIGASAMVFHGVSRATQDVDILVTERDVLLGRYWRHLDEAGVELDIRVGDHDDPLAGVVRCEEDAALVDVIVARGGWEGALIDDATPHRFLDVTLPVVSLVGLVLLKLYAGGHQDIWDIHQLIEAGPTDAPAEISSAAEGMPAVARALWKRIEADRKRS